MKSAGVETLWFRQVAPAQPGIAAGIHGVADRSY